MAEHASLLSLVIVIVAAFLTPIILHRLKLNFVPVVIAEIIVGLIIGKSGLDIVSQDMWLETLSTLGFLFLMFLSGLEIDFSAFSNKKKEAPRMKPGKEEPHSFMAALIIFTGILVLSFGLSYLFVLLHLIDDAFLMTLIISTISLGVVVPTLKEAHLMKTVIGQIILLVAVIADLVTMILLTVFVSLNGSGGGNMWLLLVLFAAGVILYFIAKRFKNKPLFEALSTSTVQIGTRAVFTLMIVLVALSEYLGAENILGAFLAGVLVSLLAPNHELVRQLDSFGYGFLIPIFFVMVGVELDLWSLLSDKKMLMMIPLLMIAFFISKVFPLLYLKKWYDTKTVMASAFLLTSTLSLVIAAAKIAERIGVITSQMSGLLVLVAVVTCLITPIVFKKLFPPHMKAEKRIKIVFVGANQYTMPISKELKSALYDTVVYRKKPEVEENNLNNSVFDVEELEDLTADTLDQNGVFAADILVFATGNLEQNAELAIAAKERGVERVIAHVEQEEMEQQLIEAGIETFSYFLSAKALLRALIESPSIINILTNKETSLYEVELLNDNYEGLTLRKFPFTGDVIFVRIFRGNESIVPHGDTELRLHDRLILTGSKEYVDELKLELEYGG
ncbi:monovalent cation:proton antiporter family protein [Pseudobacillus wudalianchiensis]|uniref:Sodium:proton antiporter n=1 Tax=Pseudobacillus wudalianchiensis TaxID=1743143 RepID=A0A1B9ATZ2_9BACI|nr:monovalent cation:proton antiporter family protein [Bacillus wudalianchiensis]OCA87347.1 sodium:proton antiporter [Bacillus wudalianchiensis]